MMSNDTKTTVDKNTFTITFKRTLSASREQVFDAWTRPEHIQYWWDPTGARLSECLVDLRPGGAFKFVNQDSGHSPPFSGTYVRVERPSKLEFEALGALGTVALESKESVTHMTVSIRCASAEHLEQFIKLGVDVGTAQTLDNLVSYLQQNAPHSHTVTQP
jgi:uncharacterized protein YndB with AHSA1/START domain